MESLETIQVDDCQDKRGNLREIKPLLKSIFRPFKARALGSSPRRLTTQVTPQLFSSATTLLPGQDNSAPSGPMSDASSVVVSCWFRLSEVGLWEFRKPQVAGSIPVAGSIIQAVIEAVSSLEEPQPDSKRRPKRKNFAPFSLTGWRTLHENTPGSRSST